MTLKYATICAVFLGAAMPASAQVVQYNCAVAGDMTFEVGAPEFPQSILVSWERPANDAILAWGMFRGGAASARPSRFVQDGAIFQGHIPDAMHLARASLLHPLVSADFDFILDTDALRLTATISPPRGQAAMALTYECYPG